MRALPLKKLCRISGIRFFLKEEGGRRVLKSP